MAQEYGRFECKVCGDQVFVPFAQQPGTAGASQERQVELTCSQGHTDSYETSKVTFVSAKPVAALKARRAMAGIG